MPDTNIGNNLLKYSMYHFLNNLGFKPTLISLESPLNNDFLRKYLNIKEIRKFNQLNENDFDILIVNSDQCWNSDFPGILELGFLSFAKNWNITKFVYAASLGHDSWNVSNNVINSARELVKQFSDISVREETSIKIINNYLDVTPSFVLDPTFLLDKNDYLKIIENYKNEIDLKRDYICKFILDDSSILNDYIEKASKEINCEILNIIPNNKNYIEKFIISIDICKSIITDSFHGTIFSIIFNKPFLTFINIRRGNARFFSLNKTFNLNNRIIFPRKFVKKDVEILMNAPRINKRKFNVFRRRSIKFLYKNLGI